MERDTKVRAAADKVADSLDKITVAETKRAAQLEKSKAVNEAVAASEAKLSALLKTEAADSDAVSSATAELSRLKERQTKVNTQLVTSSTSVSKAERDKARAIREASQAYRDMGNDVDGLGSKLASLGSAGGSLKLNLGLAALGTLPAAATAITEVAGALQQLAGAGFAVPGIFAGIAASVGVGALGMYGMSDAITAVSKASDGTKASVEAADKALAALPASSADVVRTVVGLKGTFTELQGIASNNMFAGVSDGLKGLLSADLPAITRGVDGISQGINQNLLQAMNSLGSQSSQGFLDKIFGNTADAQARLTKAIDPAIHAIGTLTAAGSESLPRLADAVGKVAERFDRFISAADGDGRLDKWINEGLDGFTSLGNIVLNLGKSFGSVTQAAGGGAGLLGTLESATGKMATFLSSAEGQAKLRDYFQQGRDMLSQLKDVATTAGPVLAGLFQSGINAANLWLPVIKEVLSKINSIPGGAATVVGAFAAWKTITGVASLATSLSKVTDLLGGMPGKASAAGGAMNSALKLAGPIAAAIALKEAYDGVLGTINKITGTNWATTLDPLGSKFGLKTGWDQLTGNPQMDAAEAKRQEALNQARLNPVPLLPGSLSTDTLSRKDDMSGVPDSMINPTNVPGITGYVPPVITDGGSGSDKTPFIDPSKYMMGDPLAGLPGAVPGADPAAIYAADSKVISATHNLEQGRLALQVLEAKGNATQQELLTAKNNLQEQERALYDAQADDIKARSGQMKQATSDLKDVFAPLDQDFGVSKGLPGIVDNLVKALGNFALGGAIRSDPNLQAAAMSMLAPQSASGGVSGSASYGYGMPLPGVSPGGSYGLPGGTNTGGYGSGGKGIFPDWVQQVGAAFGVKPSTYAGHQESDRNEAGYAANPGHENRGIDWTGTPEAMQKFADYLKNVPGMEQVIWNGAGVGTGDTVEIAGGRSQPGYFAGDLAGHGNHVHTRQSAPIPLPGGMAGPTAGYAPSAPVSPWFPSMLPTLPAGAGGEGYMGLGGAPLQPNIGPSPLQPGGIPLGTGAPVGVGPLGTNGLGASALATPVGFQTGVQQAGGGGGTGGIGAGGDLIGAASMAADVVAPGSSIGIKLANRAIQFAGQAAAIGVQGLQETFLPAGSPLAANSWFSKIAGGLAGARPATPNKAGGPNGGAPGQQPPAMGSPASGQGAGPAPGPTFNTTVNNNRATEDGTGRDLTAHLSAQYSGVGR